jgi:hypothetical protein
MKDPPAEPIRLWRADFFVLRTRERSSKLRPRSRFAALAVVVM